MEALLLEILGALKETGQLDSGQLAKIIHRHNRGLGEGVRHYAKKRLVPYYLKVKESDPERWAGWDVDAALERRLLEALRVKPRRTASGVATITVLTKPWPCANDCLYCPNDVRMPKSYLADEPGCQRAERNWFDPYLQVVSRLRALTQMGHVTDKVELIILGGTWSDYPLDYQLWFVTELFRALNDDEACPQSARDRRGFYVARALSNRGDEIAELVRERQREVDEGRLSYNQAVKWPCGHADSDVWRDVAAVQVASFEELVRQHTINEFARHRVVGLSVETRSDTVTCENLLLLRRLGCTKIQIGIQSLDPRILALNNRAASVGELQRAFELLRLFGFKIHTHFMLNLYGSSPKDDKVGYRCFVTEGPYQPDEVKLYPCSLVAGTRLCKHYTDGSWRPYDEGKLLDVLTACTLATPPFVRISRMVRDISAHDILAGNRKANLRQLVEGALEKADTEIAEIRYREIGTAGTDVGSLRLATVSYETTVSDECFLQWVTPENRIAGFLRLSLPKAERVLELLRQQPGLPVSPHEAMIREIHVYGRVAGLRGVDDGNGADAAAEATPAGAGSARVGASEDGGAQHLGLGGQLIKAACAIAKEQGYERLNVISSVGTREYYRNLGFKDNGLYQQLGLFFSFS